jgi:hypothetical protein
MPGPNIFSRILDHLSNNVEGVGAEAKAPPNSIVWPNGAYSSETGDAGIDVPAAINTMKPDLGPNYMEGMSMQHDDPNLYAFAKDQQWRNRIYAGKDGPGMGEVMTANTVSNIMKRNSAAKIAAHQPSSGRYGGSPLGRGQ